MKQRDIFVFWLPLFASWLLMTSEGPLISAAINRLPNEVVMLAAMGIVFSIAVAIESPIINLLATSTAKVRDRASYCLVRRFTVHWMVGLTVIGAAVALDPLFELLIVRLLGTPPQVAAFVQPGLMVMIPWSAAIAWRRFLQGVLIAHSRTRMVAWGTAIRLVGSGGTAIGLAVWGEVSGVLVGTIALMVGVVFEALFATWAVQPVLDRELALAAPAESGSLSYGSLMSFHLPLASASVLTLLMQPLVTACLARLDRPVETLAAWPMIFQFMLLARAVAFALPEVVIALSHRPGSEPALRRFSWNMTWASLGGMLLFGATPLARFYLSSIQSAAPGVVEVAMLGFLLLIPLPPLSTLTSWYRGLLIHRQRTTAVNKAMMIRLAVTAVVLVVGLWMRAPGIATAAAAIVLSSAAELGGLAFSVRRSRG
ncbi:MAG: hypothetical protein K8J08_03155 [Thermoanaerobaculia bacterium]|nr:hypothetical protein [Thermoanaerobaculia bacterium]